MKFTDSDWEIYGRTNPYFAVITDPKFDRDNLDEQALSAFFETGENDIMHLTSILRERFGPISNLQTGIDFGCGVGRLLLPLAAIIPQVTGVDVSEGMLAEARKNLDSRRVPGVRLLQRLEDLPPGSTFDLVHSFIVLQHISKARGQELFGRLVGLVNEGGIGALHILYHNPFKPNTLLRALHNWYSALNIRIRACFARLRSKAATSATESHHHMEMNPYDLNRIFLYLHEHGIRDLHVEFTNHGGFLGCMLCFRKPVQSASETASYRL